MTQNEQTKRNGLLHRFARANHASVAVEFAMTALPFFMVLFAIIEGGIVFFATATLENGVNDVGRLIRTGQAQTANMTSAQLVQKICSEVVFMSNCTNTLKLDVRTYSSFSSVAFPSPVDADGKLVSTLQFNTGSAGDIVLIRAFYVWNILGPLPTGLANNTATSRLIQSSTAFRNEPYTSS